MKSRSHVIIIGIFALLLAVPAFAGWQSKVSQNQLKATKYIIQLKNGANPDTITRPQLRHDKNWKAKQSQKEIIEMMTRAEKLARDGRHNLIKKPVFKIKALSEK